MDKSNQIDDSEVKLLKILDKWHKPLTGLAEYDSKLVWFEAQLETRYILYNLDEQQLLDCEYWQSSDSKWTWSGPVFESKDVVGWFIAKNNQDFV